MSVYPRYAYFEFNSIFLFSLTGTVELTPIFICVLPLGDSVRKKTMEKLGFVCLISLLSEQFRIKQNILFGMLRSLSSILLF